MHVVLGILGFLMIFVILGDAFETIVLPRRVTRKFRLARLFYRHTWPLWRGFAQHFLRKKKRRESFMGFFGPLSLIGLIALWAIGLIAGFGFLGFAFGADLASQGGNPGLVAHLYYSGTTFTTVGLGDLHPTTDLMRFLTVWEAGTGFGFLAIVIGYLPVLYQAFSTREANITLLDSRAGSPPTAVELIRRHAASGSLDELTDFLREWEHWAARLMESHISFPVLMYYRSQHDNESWLASLTAIIDACALIIVGVDGVPRRQAELTFAIARHALVDLTQVLNAAPVYRNEDRLPPEAMQQLRSILAEAGAALRDGEEVDHSLAELRALYEPYVYALSNFLAVAVPAWLPNQQTRDNWQTSAWERISRRLHPQDLDQMDEHL